MSNPDPQLEELQRLRARYDQLVEEGADAPTLSILLAAIIERFGYYTEIVRKRRNEGNE